ncbi:putative porin [Gillisia sp. Q332]|uniref:putative porin n=1 Tax=Gillisia xinjiangensis TaxID=3384765 RepID=UPI00391BF703
MRKLILIFFLFFSICSFGQGRPVGLTGGTDDRRGADVQQDTAQKPPITAYKIISHKGDTTYVDTSLTIQKHYKFNYLRKDNFELVPFSNVGQTYNSLAYTIKGEDLIPEFGARARHYSFMEVEDISYYEVPTPLTEAYFKTVPEQGQTLDAFFTINTSPRLNFSAAYKGLRSLGKYQHQLTSTGNFRATLSYNTLNERYRLKTHFVSQDLLNQENGGLNDQALQQYVNEEIEFEDRSLLEVKFENAENVLFGKRFYLDQEYDLVKGEENRITLHHILDFSDKKYIFRQSSAASDIFGETFRSSNLRDQVKNRHINNTAAVSYENSTLGKLTAKAGMSYYNYGYNSILILDENEVITNRLVGENYSAGVAYTNNFGGFGIYGDAMVNLLGDFSGHYLTAGAGYSLNENNSLSAEINSNERAPNFNFLLNQSDYFDYNWQTDFDNQSLRSLTLKLDSKNLLQLDAAISQIDQYAYFSRNEEGAVKPFQFDATVNYIKLKAGREFSYGKFSLDNTLMYQTVTSGAEVFKVPAFVTRNSLYFSDHLFRKALFLQTGFTLKYFTPYEMNGYDPVLAEFYVQNEQELGGYPVVDFFLNARIRQTRIFFKLEHVNSLINVNNNFVAPDYPHRDFLVRFGLVWNFFL